VFGVLLAPDIKDMKALATALKFHSHFDAVDRLAREWIERDKRSLKPEDLESDERRKWYDLRDGWERATERLKKAVDKFRQETGFSPILRYYREVDSMGQVGKVFLGYDSVQAKGYRIIQIVFPAWFEELNLPTEEMSEEDVYRLVPVERMGDEEERTLRQSFVEDLREGGIERFMEYMPRYESTIDKRRTYNENVFRVDDLVKRIIRERALVPRLPTPLAVAAPPVVKLAPPTVKSYAELEAEFKGKDLVDALASYLTNYYGLRRDYLLEDLNAYLRSLKNKLTNEDIQRFYQVYPNLKESLVTMAGLISWLPSPPAPTPKEHRLENWYIIYAPHLKEAPYRWNYQYEGSWNVLDFANLDDLNKVVGTGRGEIYLHALRQRALATWTPTVVPEPKKMVGEERQTETHRYTLEQPIFESVPKVWMWRVSVWNKEKNESEPEIQMTEEDFDKIRPAKVRNAVHKLFWLPSPRSLPALWSEITIEGKPAVRGYREIRAAPKEAIIKEIREFEKAQIIEANYPWTLLNVEYPTSIEKIIETIPSELILGEVAADLEKTAEQALRDLEGL